MSAGKKRLVILGGGVGAMSAAFELTSSPGWQERYEVSVLQMGWRLGGKGASGRNRAVFDRIEEHGLHLWFGCYENAFHLMQRCYAELGRKPGEPLATWQDAFHKHSLFVFGEFWQGGWSWWPIVAPENDEVPGSGRIPALWEILDRMIACVHGHFLETCPDDLRRVADEGEHPGWFHALAADLDVALEHVSSCLTPLLVARTALGRGGAAADPQQVVRCLDAFWSRIRGAVERILGGWVSEEILAHPPLRRLLSVLELLIVTLKGVLRDEVVTRGFESIDDVEYRTWIAKHGAGPLALNADILRVAYEAGFCYRQGYFDQPDVAAGVCVKALARLCFTYKGAIAWKMQAGMGDTVFAPLYQVLRRRGVRFEFFRKVKRLELTPDGKRIAAIRLGVQATTKTPPYDPLYDVKGLPCWPSEPLYEQLVQGEDLRRSGVNLESAWSTWPDVDEERVVLGETDQVVLGISLGALPEICGELIAARPEWRAMVENVETVETQAFQLWLKPDLAALGWSVRVDDALVPPVVGGFQQPFNTYGDMSHLIERESWPPESRPGSIAYFCGPLAHATEPLGDRSFAEAQNLKTRERIRSWITSNAGVLWPKGVVVGYPAGFSDVFDPLGLVAPGRLEASGPERIDLQFWRTNIDPSERYVTSTAGSMKWRLDPGSSGFDNLVLAGDWTRNGMGFGCVEAAVMSGMAAARAVSGLPLVIFGQDDWPGRETGGRGGGGEPSA